MTSWRVHAVSWVLLLGLAAHSAQPQELQPIRVHMHGSEGYAADGTLYSPNGTPPFAAIVLIPDEKGITPRITATASHLLSQGYLVVALDLNRGLSPDAATHSDDQAMHDLDAAVAFVSAQSSVVHDAIGLMGWQSGGAYAVKYALDPRIKAVAIIDPRFHADLPDDALSRVPTLAVFSGPTEASKQAIHAFQLQARRPASAVTVKVYPKAEMDFDDSADPVRYRSADAADLRERESGFFSQYLHR